MHKSVIWIWSLLLTIALVLFRLSAVLAPPMLAQRSWIYLAVLSSVAMRIALLVSIFYLLQFLRYHLFRAQLALIPPQPTAPENPPVSYTLTGEPVSSGEETIAGTPAGPDANDGTRFLSYAFAAIAVALGIEVAAQVCTLLVPIAS